MLQMHRPPLLRIERIVREPDYRKKETGEFSAHTRLQAWVLRNFRAAPGLMPMQRARDVVTLLSLSTVHFRAHHRERYRELEEPVS